MVKVNLKFPTVLGFDDLKLLESGAVEDSEIDNVKSQRKPLPAGYEPDKRTTAWLKLKKDYVTGIGDTLDLIPIGAWHGNGRKVQWWSPILLALWDPGRGLPVAVCKCMSGTVSPFRPPPGINSAKDSPMCSTRFVNYFDLGWI
jgi:DNA ligase-1